MDNRNLLELLRKIIIREIRYLRTYSAKVVDVTDELKKGRVKVQVPALAWDDNNKAVWCFPTDKYKMTVPAVDDWVRIGFMEGNINRGYYFGTMNNVEGMVPKNFDGMKETQIIYEDANEEMFIKYDETAKEFSWEDSHGNTYTQDSTGITIEDTNGNTAKMSKTGIDLEDLSGNTVTMSATGIDLEDLNSNTVSMQAGKIQINGDHLEIT